MFFVQSGMLAALAALAIPIAIHLMSRRRARTVELGTLQFLRVVLRENAGRRRLKRYALLALRLAAVALIALLFARPFLLAEEPGGADRRVVVLVDRSATMGRTGGGRPVDRALAEVRAIAARSGPGTRLEIAAFDRAVTPVAKLDDLEGALAGPLGGGTDYDAALAWARDVLIRSAARGATLHILTDLQRSGLNRGDAPRLPAAVDVRLADLGRSFARNVGVTAIATVPASPRPREPVVVTATVFNASPLPAEKVPVRLHLDAAEGAPALDLDRTIDLDGGASATVEFPLPGGAAAVRRGYAEARAGDDFAADDRRYLAFAVAEPARVLLVDGDPGRTPPEDETYFLATALRLAPVGETYAKAPFAPEVVGQYDLRNGWPDLARTSAVVLANVADLTASNAEELARYVRGGGGLLVFTGDRVTADGAASLLGAGLGVGAIGGPRAATDRPWRLDRWDATAPLLRPFAEPEHGDLRRPMFSSITAITPDADARVLAWFRGDMPALLERPVGRGRVIWFASGCDRAWGDWPKGRMFLPLVHQMVATAAGLADGGPIRAELAGATRAPGLVEADGTIRVVNLDPAESATARCTPREFADRYGFRLPEPGARDDPKPGDAPGRPDDRTRSDEIWPWIALGLIGVLLIEQFLANRTAA